MDGIPDNPTDAQLQAYAAYVQTMEDAKNYYMRHKREFPPQWYDWQQELFNTHDKQVMLLAANRVGKTWSAAYRVSCDLTGHYPDNWDGFKQTHAPVALAMGIDNTQLKNVIQHELFGTVTEEKKFTGGWIHPDEILRIVWNNQVTGLVKEVTIKSKYGRSVIELRPYSVSKTGTGSLTISGTNKDLIWVDECPPDDIIGQLITRTTMGNYGKGGRILYTLTPELGATQLVTQFLEDRKEGQKLIGPVSWDECPHISPERQLELLSGIPEHEHEMRSKGIPFFGSGMVYPIAEDRISVPDMKVPTHWRVIRAMDLGINHPTAIVWLAHDTETDTIYVVKTYAVKGENAATHAAAANKLYDFAPVVFPHDVDMTEKGSGKTVRKFYNEAGLTRTLDFKNADGSISVEPGIMQLMERMRDGRFKVFHSCIEFFREFRLYHRKEGKLVKENDDVLDAVRYGAIMLGRYGVPIDKGYRRKPKYKRAMKKRR